jgi:hypothetical protein
MRDTLAVYMSIREPWIAILILMDDTQFHRDGVTVNF